MLTHFRVPGWSVDRGVHCATAAMIGATYTLFQIESARHTRKRKLCDEVHWWISRNLGHWFVGPAYLSGCMGVVRRHIVGEDSGVHGDKRMLRRRQWTVPECPWMLVSFHYNRRQDGFVFNNLKLGLGRKQQSSLLLESQTGSFIVLSAWLTALPVKPILDEGALAICSCVAFDTWSFTSNSFSACVLVVQLSLSQSQPKS